MELPSDHAKLTDPELYLASHEDKPVVLDEIRRTRGLFQALRRIIGRQRLSLLSVKEEEDRTKESAGGVKMPSKGGLSRGFVPAVVDERV